MDGLMMDRPLLLKTLLWRAERVFGDNEIVTATGDRSHRYTYGEYALRVRRLASGLRSLGVGLGTRVGTLAWNHWRHFEAYYAVPCMGAVLHTANLRLSPEHLAFTINRARDEVLLVDQDQIARVEEILPSLQTIRAIVVLGEAAAHVLARPEVSVHPYEQLIDDAAGRFDFPDLDERAAAALCFTSATTGEPKGVVYSHRSMVLHTLAQCVHGSFGVREDMTLLAISPMFHANSWGLPHAAAAQGAKLVLPGVHPNPGVYLDLIEREHVTHAFGAVTVGIQLRDALEANPGAHDLSSLEVLLLGGQAAPRSLMEYFDRQGVYVPQGWGMTEASPFATWNYLRPRIRNCSPEQVYRTRLLQGLPLPLVEIRIAGPSGEELPWDGSTAGEYQLRAPWVAAEYLDDPERSRESMGNGWYRTGDVGVIEPTGYVHLMDRAKDLIKSGGEWISSIDLEGALMAHPKVAEAAVVAVPDERWLERPVAAVVPLDAGSPPSASELAAHLGDRFPRWWVPDRFELVSEIPKTGVGKFDKKRLRAAFDSGPSGSRPGSPAPPTT
jgi:fatty-acyl-CoA synthase